MQLNIFKNIILISLLSIVLISCIERNLDPFEEESGFYSFYGAIDADLTRNAIRIRNTKLPPIDEDEIFDAQVQFENTEHGTTIPMEHKIVDFSGFITHNFLINQKLHPESIYKLRVFREGIKPVQSYVTIPGFTEVNMLPEKNISCNTKIEITYTNVVFPEQIWMEVGIQDGGETRWVSLNNRSIRPVHKKESDEMFLSATIQNLVWQIFPPNQPGVRCDDVDIIFVRYRHLSKEWEIFEEGRFPADHSQWQDVENGSGFLGAFRKGEFIIPVDF